MKYNNPEEWKYTKGLAAYLRRYPTSSKAYYDVQQALANTQFKRSVVLPPQNTVAYVLPHGTHDPAHIMKRMLERGISDDALRGYISDARVMLVQWGGQRRVFLSDDGTCVITKVGNDWLFRTAWTKYDNDEDTEAIF